ncbi:MAG: RpiB/LacA/LacB family sugar-phosphate isomerase [Candidatus Doudnabacteria bacterium]|nr:RpiB/LacA/LacB family sugar-phosphate isomerase [Candidatus Doudnabacteria bacterium]
MIYIASDHGGFKLKEAILKFLFSQKIKFTDLGPVKFEPADDYPDFAKMAAKAVAKHPTQNIGILMCRSGQGMCIAANKVKGIRAASVWNEKLARTARNDDMANIICLASDYLRAKEAKKIVKIFINTPFSKAVRHKRRIDKIAKIEQK